MPNEKIPDGKKRQRTGPRSARTFQEKMTQNQDRVIGPRETEALKSGMPRSTKMRHLALRNAIGKEARGEIVAGRLELIQALGIVPKTLFSVNEKGEVLQYRALSIDTTNGLVRCDRISLNHMHKIRDVQPDLIIPTSIDHSFENTEKE